MALNDDENKKVTLPATGALVTVPQAAPRLKRNDPYNPTFEPAATVPSGARVRWGSDLPYASDTNRPVMTGTTSVPDAKPMVPKAPTVPVGDAPGTKPVTVPALPNPSTTKASPSQVMTDNQADARERAAATRASPARRQTDVGASVSAGGGSAPDEVIGTFNGRKITRSQADALAAKLPTVSGPVVMGPNGSYAAGAAGEQAAPVPLLSRAAVAPSMGPSLRGPDEMAEQYNSREDREARAKLASDLDSQRFRLEMIAGNPGRRGRAALEALSQNAQQRAALAGNAERLSAEALQGRANRANTLANTGLEQQGLDRRSEQDILLRRDALAAEQSGVSQVLNGENGTVSLLRRDGTVQGVQNPDGTPFRAPVQDRGQPTAADRLTFLRERMSGLEKAISDARALNPTADVSSFQAQLGALNKQADGLLNGPQQPTAAQVAALKANPDKAADFDAMFGPGAAARILGTK